MKMNIGKKNKSVLYELLKKGYHVKKDQTAITYDNVSVTYYELLRNVDKVADKMCEKKLGNRTIALIMDNSLEFITILFALSKVRATIFLINPNFDITIIRKLIKIGNVENIITDRSDIVDSLNLNTWVDIYHGVNIGKIDVTHVDMQKYGQLIQTSSGTTGIPKICIRNYKNICSDMRHISSTYGYKNRKKIYAAVPFYHGYGLTMGLLAPIEAGMEIVCSKFFMPNRFCSYVKENNIDFFLGAPNTYKIFCGYEKEMKKYINEIPVLISSGSPITKELAMSFYKIYQKWIVETYGMMEASSITANLNPNCNNYYSVGKSVHGVKLKLLKDYIYIKSDAVSKYYLTEQGIKEIELVDNWFCTMDTGVFLNTGELIINGREKQL